jgi:hypothetical protein
MASKNNNNALEKEIRKPIRHRVIRPGGLALTDRETIKAANAEMLRLEAEAVEAARQEKLRLLLRRYSLADDDWYGLALALAVDHEPGFRVKSQLVQLTVVDNDDARLKDQPGFSGPVIIGDKTVGRPSEWSWDRLERLVIAVEKEKKKNGLTNDIEALERIIGKGDWRRPLNCRGSWLKALQNRLAKARWMRRRIDEASEQLKAIFEEIRQKRQN